MNNINTGAQAPLTPTSLEDLARYSKGSLIQLPSFGDGQPFVAYVRRPSLLILAANGSIPNSLLGMATKLFKQAGSVINEAKPEDFKEATKVFEILAEAALVEPTYQQIKEAGLNLTDEQLALIFNYTQQGVKALEPFRAKQKNSKLAGGKPKIRQAPVRGTTDN